MGSWEPHNMILARSNYPRVASLGGTQIDESSYATIWAKIAKKEGFGANQHYSVWVGRHDMAGGSFLDLIWSLDSYSGTLKARFLRFLRVCYRITKGDANQAVGAYQCHAPMPAAPYTLAWAVI